MAACAPQRFLANNRNAIRTAILTPSSVQAVTDSVLEVPLARTGSAAVALTGSFSGAEEAVYDVEVLDAAVSTKVASAPVFSGVGSGTLANISSTGTAQTYTVELGDNGIPVTSAGVDFEGVRLVARASGAAGNLVRLTIDQSTLVFATTSYSLLEDLAIGAGSETQGLEGPAYDWETAVLGADNIIPATAKRIVFGGGDDGTVYLQYKRYVDGKWLYHFVPEIKRTIRAGTAVRFVTGGRTVAVTNGTTNESFSSIATLYDLLNAIKTGSALLDVVGVIANDRSPSGQAARDLQTRTDAHVEPSTGEGSDYATGFVDTYANSGAQTELITATCYAVNGRDHPLAHLGAERWTVSGSLSGDLGVVVTDELYAGANFGFRIPRKSPPDSATPKGRFSVVGVNYVARDAGDPDPAPLCPVALSLGPDASDQSITLTYTRRPSGDCLCDALPVPNLYTSCLGTIAEGGESMSYQAANVTRLVSLYQWVADTVKKTSDLTAYDAQQAPFVSSPSTAVGYVADSLLALAGKFESTLAELDALPAGAYYTAGVAAWDSVVTELQADVLAAFGSTQTSTFPAFEALSAGNAVGIFVDNDGITRVRKAIPGCIRYGFVISAYAAAATATVYWWGRVTTPTGTISAAGRYGMHQSTAGSWIDAATAAGSGITAGSPAVTLLPAIYSGASELYVPQNSRIAGMTALLTDRYKARLNWVYISAGISPLGKSSASVQESGDGCWQDYGDAYYWEVVGSDGGGYAPAFNNRPYYSARRASAKDKYFSTHEFAFQINVKCPNDLREGDQITLAIGDAASGATYQVGDVLTLPIIAAQALYLAGGQDGNAVQKWYVSGSVSGAMAQYTYNPATPAAYSSGGLTFLLQPGGIPFAKGDRFTFSIEGGHYRWRKTVNGVAGAWSGSLAIPAAATVLDSGLSIAFTPGAYPSFVTGDAFQFRVLQPWAVSNISTPGVERWQWSGAAPTLVADLGSSQSVSMVALARHTLSAGTTLLLEGGTAPGVYTWSQTLTWQAGSIVKEFAAQTARYLRLTLGSAAGGGIGWWWAGTPLTTSLSASVQLRRQYLIERESVGIDQGGRSLGKAVGGTVAWSEGAMSEDDMAGVTALLDWCKDADDEPFILVPQISRPTEVLLARVNTDEVDIVDVWDYQPDAAYQRRFSAELQLSGVWQ